MKRKFYILIIALVSVCFYACKNITDDVSLTVSQPFSYRPVIQVVDVEAENQGKESKLPADLSISISGKDAESVYNREGYKDYVASSGVLGLGISPRRVPTADNPVKFNVTVSGTGLMTKSVSVTLNPGDSSMVFPVNVMKLTSPPEGVTVNQLSLSLGSEGSMVVPVIISTDGTDGNNESTEITIPAGAQFKDATGAVVVGSQLKTTLIQLDPSKESSLAVFPGGALSVEDVQLENGKTGNAILNPAGYIDITMTINGKEIKQFTQPLEVSMQLDPNFYNPSTRQVIKVGDELDIYSYEVTTNRWTFEKKANVVMINGSLRAVFTISHLTGYSAMVTREANCNMSIKEMLGYYPATINFTTTFYSTKEDRTTPDKLLMTVTDGRPMADNGDYSLYDFWVNDQDTYMVVVTHSSGFEMGRAYRSGCGLREPIILTLPPFIPPVTMQLYVRCPGKTTVVPVNLMPTFEMFYRAAGTTDAYKMLGQVTNGYITTMLLEADKAYDFRAHWGNQVKYITNKVVKANNSATIGQGNGDILGNVAPENNLQILTEKCKGLGFN